MPTIQPLYGTLLSRSLADGIARFAIQRDNGQRIEFEQTPEDFEAGAEELGGIPIGSRVQLRVETIGLGSARHGIVRRVQRAE